jgi:acetylglutamate/LysW-gamma-L-alpha-aminoadipate kinase
MNMIVVKIGGGKGLDPDGTLMDIARLTSTRGQRIILVHGASHLTSDVSTRLGHPPRFVTSESGHSSRYTDKETLEIYTMVAAGMVNKQLVRRLQELGVNAVGLSGIDGRLLEGRRKSCLRIVDAGKRKVLRGEYSGTIDSVNRELLKQLMDLAYTPVIAPLMISHNNDTLNVDGDRAAGAIAAAVKAQTLVILTSVPGVLLDPQDSDSLVSAIALQDTDGYLRNVARGRMKRKVLGAAEAVQAGVARAVIGDGTIENPLLAALGGGGTVIS